MRTKLAALAVAASISVIAVACSSSDPTPVPTNTPVPATQTPTQATPTAEPRNFTVAFSDKERSLSSVAPTQDLDALVNGNTEFAFDLYRQLSSEDGNLFMSPYSVSIALAMTYAGASGQTADEMAETLGFSLTPEKLHNAFNVLDRLLAARGANLEPDQKFTLEIANSIWGQQGFEFEQPFLDTLAENYGAGMRLVDYDTQTEAARLAINGWVEDNTNDRIKDLIPQGVLNPDTVLVLANAIFFKAAWAEEFDSDLTAAADFHLLDGSTVPVEMMQHESRYRFADGDGFSAIEIPYVGGETSMVVMMPDDERFASFEASLDADRLDEIVASLSIAKVDLGFPKFSFESKFMLPEPLKALGMQSAFLPNVADFSAMRTPPPNLVITDVIHQSFVAVDEQGTEAAAATVVIVGETSAPQDKVKLTVDRPFIFLIRDIETGTVLFVGRLLDPSA